MPGTPNSSWISALYSATTEPDLWPEALASIADAVHADVGLLFGVDFDASSPTILHCTHTGSPLDAFRARHADNPWSRGAAMNPTPSVARTEDLVPVDHLVRSSFYADVLEPAGLFHSLGANLLNTPDEMICVSFLRARSRRAFDGDEMRWLGAALPDLQRAMQLTKRLAGADLLCAAALDALSMLKSPMFLLDVEGRVLFLNLAAEALVDGPAGISVREGRLCGFSRMSSRKIEQLIREARVSVGYSAYSSVPRRDGMGPLILHLTRLGDTAIRVRGRAPAFVLFLGTEAGTVDVPCGVLRDAFGLTEREVSVACLLAEGLRLPAIARTLGISINTVRSHAARVYDKTQTAGQAELVRDLPCRVPQVHARDRERRHKQD